MTFPSLASCFGRYFTGNSHSSQGINSSQEIIFFYSGKGRHQGRGHTPAAHYQRQQSVTVKNPGRSLPIGDNVYRTRCRHYSSVTQLLLQASG